MRNTLLWIECACALASCICSIVVVGLFVASWPSEAIVASHGRSRSTSRSVSRESSVPVGLRPRQEQGIPIFSTGVAFISSSVLLRSVANLFSLLQRFPKQIHSATLCNCEGALRSFAILMNFSVLFILSVQLYAKLIPDTGTVLRLENPIRWFRSVFFSREHNNPNTMRESWRDFREYLYFFAFCLPLIISLLPLIDDGYGRNPNGLALCTFSSNKHGKVWAGISLYFIMTLLWVAMLYSFAITAYRLESTSDAQQGGLFRSMMYFVALSFFIWVPLMVGTFETSAIQAWEVVIQLDGVLYFALYLNIQKYFQEGGSSGRDDSLSGHNSGMLTNLVSGDQYQTTRNEQSLQVSSFTSSTSSQSLQTKSPCHAHDGGYHAPRMSASGYGEHPPDIT